MSKLPLLSGKEMCRLVELLGFVAIHQKGSHVRYRHPDGRATVVPVHGNEDLSRGILREILGQIRLSRDDYERLRKKA